jgi:hypothetical protein
MFQNSSGRERRFTGFLNMSERKGNWIVTYTGRKWYLTDPRPEDVCIEDIAHGLAHICRFGGQCVHFYSVAEHSVTMADELRRQEIKAILTKRDFNVLIWALMHDATEAYLGDLVRPLKALFPLYKEIEARTESVILEALGLPPPDDDVRKLVKEYDNRMLMTERRDLVNHGSDEWSTKAVPFERQIRFPMGPFEAETVFLQSFDRLSRVCTWALNK